MKYNIQYKGILIFIAVMTAVFGLYGFNFNTAKAVINKQINYQGKLFTGTNTPVSDGGYNVKYRLYTTATGGSPIWTETLCYSSDNGNTCDGTGTDNRVSVSNGLFSTMLGSVTSLDTVNFNQTLYLSVEIGGSSASSVTWDGEMTPRKKIGAVPAAFEADKLDGLSSEQFIRSDADNATTSSSTFLNVIQNGAGKVAEFIGQSSASVLSILSDGKVGIGTTTPTDVLSVNGPIYLANTSPVSTANRIYANGGSLYYAGNLIGGATVGNWTSNGTDVWRTTGNVGVGTSSPYAKLSVTSTSVASTTLALRPVSSQTANIVDIFNGSGSLVSVINPFGFIGIGSTTPTGMLTITNTGTTYPSFVVEDSTSPDASPFLIDNAGLVGIGTSTPDTPLTIYSGTAIDKDAISAHGFNGSTAEKTMIRLMTGNRGYSWGIRFGAARDPFGGGSSGDAFVVNTKINNGTETERFRISKDGYVGIGSTSPFTAALSVYNNATSKNVLLLDALSGTTVPILDVKLASTTQFVVNASGNVGIGSSSPYSTLSITNTGTNPSFVVEDSTSPDSTPFIIDASGKVGINTASPLELLDLSAGYLNISAGSSACNNCVQPSGIKLASDASTNAAAPIISNVRGANSSDQGIDFRTYFSGTINAMRIIGNGNVGIGSSTPYSQLSVGGNSTSKTLFALDALSGQTQPILDVKLASTSKFMVDSSGNVGVGTSTIESLLHVVGTIRAGTQYGAMTEVATNEVRNRWVNDASNVYRFRLNSNVGTLEPALVAFSGGALKLSDSTATGSSTIYARSGGVAFYTNNNTSMFLTSAGSLGLGTTSPATQLHVSGTTPDIRQQVTSGTSYYSLTSDLNFSASDAWNLTFDTVSGASDSIIQYDSPDISKILTLGVNGGSTVLRGNIGIATSSPYAQLSVGGNSTSNTLFALDALSGQTQPILDVKLASTSKFVIDSSGNVGVGTRTPYAGFSVWGANTTSGSRNFEVVNSASTSLVYVDNAGNVNIPATTATTTIGGGLSVAGATGLTVLQNGFIQIGTSTTIANADITIQGHGSSVPYFALTNGASSPSAYFGRASAIITGGGATDFGFQATTNNSILFATNGSTERMRISSSGNVGIGTTSPYATLSITNTGTNPSFVVEDSTSPDTTPFIIDASGNVGIGTTTPGQKLEVIGIGRFDGTNTFSIGSDTNYNRIDTAGTGSEIFRFLSTGNNMAGIRAGSMVIGTAAPFLTATAPTQGLIVQGNVGIGTTSPLARLDVAGANNGTSPLFQVSSVSSFATTSRFIVDSSGNVGIGTTSPSTKLVLSGSSNVTTLSTLDTATTLSIENTDTTNNNLGTLAFRTNDVNGTLASGVHLESVFTSHAASAVSADFLIQTRNAGSLTEKLRVTGAGNVGIGTTTPMSVFTIEQAGDPIMTFSRNDSSVTTGESLGTIQFLSNDASTDGKNIMARIQALAGVANGSGRDTDLVFSTANNYNPGGNNLSEKMRILANGYVGIGTTSPYRTLSVAGSGVFTGGDVLASTFTATSSISAPSLTLSGLGLNMLLTSNGSGMIVSSSTPTAANYLATSTTATSTFAGGLNVHSGQFVTDYSSGNSWFGSGNVGIGTTSPYTQLSVGGNSTSKTLFALDALSGQTAPILDVKLASTSKFMVDSSGNVGIGTTTPSVGLTIGSGISYLCPQVLLSTSTSMTVDFNAGCNQIVRMGTSNTTISFTNGQPGQKLELTVCNPTTTSGNITFSGNMSYPGGLAPSHTTTANECDIYNFGVNYATTTAKYLLTGMQSGFK